VRPYPEGHGRWLVSVGGGTEPLWSPSGHALFYRNGDEMMEVSVRTEPTFKVEPPTVVFTKSFKIRRRSVLGQVSRRPPGVPGCTDTMIHSRISLSEKTHYAGRSHFSKDPLACNIMILTMKI